MKIILFNAFFFILFQITKCVKIFQDRVEVKGDSNGENLYNTLVVTQAMKRPNKKWFLNVFNLKPNDKYFSEAQYNGLRYQTELLQDNINNNFNEMYNDYYQGKLDILEQKSRINLKYRKH